MMKFSSTHSGRTAQDPLVSAELNTMSGPPRSETKALPEVSPSAEDRFRVKGAEASPPNRPNRSEEGTTLVDEDGFLARPTASLALLPAPILEQEEGDRELASSAPGRHRNLSRHLRIAVPVLLLALAVVALAVYPMIGLSGRNTAFSRAATSPTTVSSPTTRGGTPSTAGPASTGSALPGGAPAPATTGIAGEGASGHGPASPTSGPGPTAARSSAAGNNPASPSSSHPASTGSTGTAPSAPAPTATTGPAPAAGPVVAPAIPGVRAMWLWHAGLVASAPDQVLAFARANHVNLIYLQISGAVSSSAYSGFVAAATSSGIGVYALGGSPDWATDPTHAGLTGLVDWVSAYNASVAPASRFSGMNLDLEPYTLSTWTSDQSGVVQAWMDNVAYLEGAVHGIGLPLSLTLPFWLNQYPAGQSGVGLGLWMIEHSDSIDIMAYRSTLSGSNGVAAVATPLLSAATSAGHKAMVAVDTTPGLSTSFTSQGSLVAALDGFTASFGQLSGFGGYAVNDYENWSSLPQ